MEELRRGSRTIVATVARGGEAPGPIPENAAVLIGSEAHGLPDELVASADVTITVPMSPSVESLNAAVAGAIVAYLGTIDPATNLLGP